MILDFLVTRLSEWNFFAVTLSQMVRHKAS